MELDIVRENFPTLTGSTSVIEEIVSRKKVVDKRALGGISAVTLAEALSSSETVRAQAEGIDISTADDPTLINLLASTERN